MTSYQLYPITKALPRSRLLALESALVNWSAGMIPVGQYLTMILLRDNDVTSHSMT